MQQHSSLLIEKLANEIGTISSRQDKNDKNDDLGAELCHDINQLLTQYDEKLNVKRNLLLIELIENDQEEQDKLAESFQRKDDLHQSRFKELKRQVSLFKNASL